MGDQTTVFNAATIFVGLAFWFDNCLTASMVVQQLSAIEEKKIM